MLGQWLPHAMKGVAEHPEHETATSEVRPELAPHLGVMACCLEEHPRKSLREGEPHCRYTPRAIPCCNLYSSSAEGGPLADERLCSHYGTGNPCGFFFIPSVVGRVLLAFSYEAGIIRQSEVSASTTTVFFVLFCYCIFTIFKRAFKKKRGVHSSTNAELFFFERASFFPSFFGTFIAPYYTF